jgi:DNA topoisomerase-1
VTSVAQQLYEGISINGKHIALISYPRTDSIRIASSFVPQLKKFIESQYGKEYFVQRNFDETNKKDAKKNVQDGHESIRVVDVNLTPDDLKDKISIDQYRLYKLI